MAMDPQGDAVAVWQRGAANGFEEIQAAFRPAGGSWQKTESLAEGEGNLFNPGLAVNSKGDAVAIWVVQRITSTSITGSIQSALRPAGESWQAPVNLSEGEGLPSVAIDPQGDVVAVWEGVEHVSVIQSALRPAGASWQKTENLLTAAPDEQAENPQVATDSHGDAVAVGVGANGGHYTIRAVARTARGRCQAPVTLSEAGARAAGAFPPRPQLAMDPRAVGQFPHERRFRLLHTELTRYHDQEPSVQVA
jgi:hypothetical protein